MFEPLDDSLLDKIATDLRENIEIWDNRVIVSACSPRIHELTFRKALENAGLNPYMFEMANIREHVSWVHTDRDEATKKAKALVTGAVHRVSFHEPLDKRRVDVDPATLVIGGGISGISAAIEIANSDKKVYLIEKTGKIGGRVAELDLTYPYLDSAKQLMSPGIKEVQNHKNIDIFLDSEIKDVTGYVGNFETTVFHKDGKETELKFGNIVVATGLKPFEPGVMDNYGYGKIPDVVTSIEFEKMLSSGKILTKEGRKPENIAIIHCV